jgi:hypothetical protein
MARRRGDRTSQQQYSSTSEEELHDTDNDDPILSPSDYRRPHQQKPINDGIIARDIRACFDAFDSDENHTFAMKFLFKKGLALGLFARGEAIGMLKERPSDDAACGDDDSAVTSNSPDSQSKTTVSKKKAKTASPADNLAKKNKSILGSFGCGGLRVDKLIRCLNNSLISFGSSMADYQNLLW